MATPRVLIVDDDNLIRWTLGEALSDAGYDIREAATAAAVPDAVAAGVDLVLLDLNLPDGNGLELLKSLRETDPELVVIMLTGERGVDTVVQAMQAGAYHYLAKPVNASELTLLVRNALETTRLRRELHALRRGEAGSEASGLDLIVGRSDAINRTRDLLTRLARSPASTVLITGETGTGKDLAARVIHQLSDRGAAAFTHITCTALAETLFESELFGHEKGAFTDARSQRKGLIEQSHGGTVFLDEIGELSMAMQAKLLRFLEDKTIRRVGGTTDILVDVRVVAATNRDLADEVQAGRFREDLYFRLQVLPIELPPLRERTGDVPLLAQHFADLFARRFHKTLKSIAPEALDRLDQHHWPGNVRELRNTMERAMLLCADSGVLTPDDLLLPGSPGAARGLTAARGAQSAGPAEPAAANGDRPFMLPEDGIVFEELERDLVRQALERTHGNQTRAGALLGMHRDQIRYRISKFDLGDVGKPT